MNLRRLAESIAFALVLIAVPVALIDLLLPVNEYDWMACEGTVPPDCDITTGLFLLPAGIVFVAGLAGFGLLLVRGRSNLRVAGAALSSRQCLE